MPNRRTALISLVMIHLSFALGSPARSALPDIYPPPEHASADIVAALKSAAASHKRVILDFGGNWCTDCQKTGEFETMRYMQTGAVTDFLVRWKPPG